MPGRMSKSMLTNPKTALGFAGVTIALAIAASFGASAFVSSDETEDEQEVVAEAAPETTEQVARAAPPPAAGPAWGSGDNSGGWGAAPSDPASAPNELAQDGANGASNGPSKSRQALGQEIRQFAVDRQPLLDRALYLEQHPAPRPFPGRAENPCQLSPSNKRTSIKAIDQRVCLSRRDRRIAAVVVKAPIGLFAEPPGLNILHQQRCWAIFGVARCLIKNLDDIEAGIEPNEVSQL